jgi:ethanolaminephosphotransferase
LTSLALIARSPTHLVRWEEYHTGTLYLSAFSGPVEGILMICCIYLVTALHPLGPAFWAQPLVSLFPGHLVSDLAGQFDAALGLGGGKKGLATLECNTAFMLFGAVGTVANIVNA